MSAAQLVACPMLSSGLPPLCWRRQGAAVQGMKVDHMAESALLCLPQREAAVAGFVLKEGTAKSIPDSLGEAVGGTGGCTWQSLLGRAGEVADWGWEWVWWSSETDMSADR